MCLIVFAYKQHPDYKLILTANRDEFYGRPTMVANWWEDHTNILGGRDLKAKGTWMGVSTEGRFSAVTNYRDLSNIRENVRSRGDLPLDFLKGDKASQEYWSETLKNANHYNGFNLLTLDAEMAYLSNYENKINILKAGVYGLSNALLNTSWPKVERAKRDFQNVIGKDFTTGDLITLMQNERVAPDNELPQTGLPIERERAVSAMCIRTPSYGTCCSTAILIDYEGNVSFLEKSYPVGEREDSEVSFSFIELAT